MNINLSCKKSVMNNLLSMNKCYTIMHEIGMWSQDLHVTIA